MVAALQREWSDAERREVSLLGGLPLACAAVLAGVVFALDPSIWPIAFVISVVCAYTSLIGGVVPLLLLLRRLGWRRWYHYAVAGYAGVLVVWLVPVAVLVPFHSSVLPVPESDVSGAVMFLSVPGLIAACAAVLF